MDKGLDISEFVESFKSNDLLPFKIRHNREKIISCLSKLDTMIEMKDVKKAFVHQLKLLILNGIRGIKPSFNKMHTVFAGPPGVGKTTVAKIVAEIWDKMGLINREETEEGLMVQDYSISIVLSEIMDLLVGAMKILDNHPECIDDVKNREDIYHKCFKSNEICYDLLNRYQPQREDSDELVRSKTFIDDEDLFYSSEDPVKSYIVAGREDFVAGYHGQTSDKTRRFLDAHKGKVIIIEEAYLLHLSKDDSFGLEALTIINRYMDEKPNSYIFIFTGYRDLLEKTIFTAQPGLQRRIQWNFEIEGYTSKGVSNIFKQQVEKSGWKIRIPNIENFFRDHRENFTSFGGDTERLFLHCQLVYASKYYLHKDHPLEITEDILREAYTKYLESGYKYKKSSPPFGMFM